MGGINSFAGLPGAPGGVSIATALAFPPPSHPIMVRSTPPFPSPRSYIWRMEATNLDVSQRKSILPFVYETPVSPTTPPTPFLFCPAALF